MKKTKTPEAFQGERLLKKLKRKKFLEPKEIETLRTKTDWEAALESPHQPLVEKILRFFGQADVEETQNVGIESESIQTSMALLGNNDQGRRNHSGSTSGWGTYLNNK